MQLALRRHPDSRPAAISRIDVAVAYAPAGLLTLRYNLTGKIDDIVWPATTASSRGDGLWQHSCFEAFLRKPGSTAYCEYNFSPSTVWAAYAFTAYRAGMHELELLPPHIIVQHDQQRFTLEVQFHVPKDFGASSRLALSAVIEERDGTLSYWSLNHPAGKPDFHHLNAFALELSKL